MSNYSAKEKNRQRAAELEEAIHNYRADTRKEQKYTNYDMVYWLVSTTQYYSVINRLNVTPMELEEWQKRYEADEPNRIVRKAIKNCTNLLDYSEEGEPLTKEKKEELQQSLETIGQFIAQDATRLGVITDDEYCAEDYQGWLSEMSEINND
jgi:NADH:ubiquinone oxidoreductase subunit D